MRASVFLPILAATMAAAIPVAHLSGQAGPVLPRRPLEPCTIDRVPGEVLCGTFTVFEDRDAGSGRTIDIRVVVLRATGEERVMDPVVPLAGGPGASGLR